MTKKQTPSTNSRAVSFTFAVPAILTVLSHTRGSKTAVLMMCSAVLRKKLQVLRDKRYNIVEIWECEWEQMKKDRADVKAFVD